jgi:beta-glucosidase
MGETGRPRKNLGEFRQNLPRILRKCAATGHGRLIPFPQSEFRPGNDTMSFSLSITPRARLLFTALIAALLWLHYVPTALSQPASKLVNPPASAADDHNFLTRLAEQRGKPCDLIFIGASNVEFWDTNGRRVWDHYYASRHALNFGVGGDTTGLALQRLDTPGLAGLRPKVAVIFIGLNNLVDTPSQVADGISAVAAKTKAVFPGVHVIVVSLTPNGRNNAHVVVTNRILRHMAASRDFTYLDLYSHMPRSGKNWAGLCPDQLHLDEHGYQIWAEQMEPLLQHLLPLEPSPLSALAEKR